MSGQRGTQRGGRGRRRSRRNRGGTAGGGGKQRSDVTPSRSAGLFHGTVPHILSSGGLAAPAPGPAAAPSYTAATASSAPPARATPYTAAPRAHAPRLWQAGDAVVVVDTRARPSAAAPSAPGGASTAASTTATASSPTAPAPSAPSSSSSAAPSAPPQAKVLSQQGNGTNMRGRKLLNRQLECVAEDVLGLSDAMQCGAVVGVLGKQGVGKSTVLSRVHSRVAQGPVQSFAVQSAQTVLSAACETLGIDVAITAERVLLLDAQPVLSPHLLVQAIKRDTVLPEGVCSAENLVLMQSLQLCVLLLAVCDVVVVVQEGSVDVDMMNLLKTALMLASLFPRAFATAANTPPHLVFVCNKMGPEMITAPSHAMLQTIVDTMLTHTAVPRDAHGHVPLFCVPWASMKEPWQHATTHHVAMQDLRHYILGLAVREHSTGAPGSAASGLPTSAGAAAGGSGASGAAGGGGGSGGGAGGGGGGREQPHALSEKAWARAVARCWHEITASEHMALFNTTMQKMRLFG